VICGDECVLAFASDLHCPSTLSAPLKALQRLDMKSALPSQKNCSASLWLVLSR
jgi:hypothetical protein